MDQKRRERNRLRLLCRIYVTKWRSPSTGCGMGSAREVGCADERRTYEVRTCGPEFHTFFIRQRIPLLAQNPCRDRKSTRLNSSHVSTSYAVFCLKKKKTIKIESGARQPPITRIMPLGPTAAPTKASSMPRTVRRIQT